MHVQYSGKGFIQKTEKGSWVGDIWEEICFSEKKQLLQSVLVANEEIDEVKKKKSCLFFNVNY